MNTRAKQWMHILVWIVFIMVLGYSFESLLRITGSLAPDFSVFYDAAKALLRGESIYTQESMYTGVGYPPVTILLYLPLTLLPYPAAQAVWVCASFVLIGYCSYLSLKLVTSKHTLRRIPLVWALALCSFPFRFTLGMGQSNIVALTFMLLIMNRLQGKSHWIGSSVLIALLFVLKPQLVVIVPVFIVYRRMHEILSAMAVLGGSIVLFGTVFGWEMYAEYLFGNVGKLMAFSSPEVYYNQGIVATISRIVPYWALTKSVWLTISFILYFITLLLVWKRNFPLTNALTIFLLVYLLIEPLSWQHHYVFLLPVFVMAFVRFKSLAQIGLIFVCYVLVSMNIPNPYSIGKGATLALSHAGIGAFVLWIYLLYSGRKVTT